MVAKKRVQLRSKAANLRKNSLELGDAAEQQQFPPDPKAYLHQAREAKKEKQLNKSRSFLTKIREQANDNVGISKSALRRRKRKQRDDLKPKMQDLLLSLQDEGVLDKDGNVQDGSFGPSSTVTSIKKSSGYDGIHNVVAEESGTVPVKKNEPSMRTQRGAKLLAKNEAVRFAQVISDQGFKKDPFATLREVIKMRK
ncbi:Slx9p Ecym_2607 [Eremothecium cymbalariae DBVPG|uniref:Ribosome biogenesis protein SLX9 n=1 Tax=Eremothecium cymbalariae (strain CBS 270.75 / DBVPG 7215 / KCTC 17166 / NRRL Y-17582) TaxID=931890 RepID=G8JQI7_ERECY|nr:Hypothetical protein Ecym_2607 [Eremothecium cymbalariae DBVPG\